MRAYRLTFQQYELRDVGATAPQPRPTDRRIEVIQYADDAADALAIAKANQEAQHARRFESGLICPGEMRFESIERVVWNERAERYFAAGDEE